MKNTCFLIHKIMDEATWKGRHKMLTKSINCIHTNNVLMEENQTHLFEK